MAKKAQMDVTIEDARALQARGAKFKGATLSQTMGPYWREIIWMYSSRAPKLGKKCYVCDTHTVMRLKEILEEIKTERPTPTKET